MKTAPLPPLEAEYHRGEPRGMGDIGSVPRKKRRAGKPSAAQLAQQRRFKKASEACGTGLSQRERRDCMSKQLRKLARSLDDSAGIGDDIGYNPDLAARHKPPFRARAARPPGRRAPDFTDRGYGGTFKPGECKPTGCYGKFVLIDGKPHIVMCQSGEHQKPMRVRDARDAKKKIKKACRLGR